MIGIESDGVSRRFKIYLEDRAPKGKMPARDEVFEGTAKQALGKAIELAKVYLQSKGEQTDYEAIWKCSDMRNLHDVPVDHLS